MWKNMAQPDRPQMSITRSMRIAHWITKATDTPIQNMQFCCFSTTVVGTQTRLNVTLQVYFLSC